jgi:hypothetical protein
MKKVLLISFHFPPSIASGAQRPYGLAKYFPNYGWEPIVLTAKLKGKRPGEIRVVETDYRDILGSWKSRFRFNPQKGLHEQLNIEVSKNFKHQTWKSKIIQTMKEVVAFPDENIGWYDFALKSASELLDKENVSAIISTSYPVTAHLIARKLKQKYKIPWVADFRDLWTQNHYLNKTKLVKYFERRLELKTISDANSLVIVHPLVYELKKLHKDKKICCITNGYDLDDFSKIQAELTNKFTLTHTGILYTGKRDPYLLFKIVRQLINEKKIDKGKIEIRFFGCNEGWLIDEVKKHNLGGIVIVHSAIPREEALRIQKESQILLIIRWDRKDEESIFPGKVFEYLGAKRPIIAIGAGGVLKDLLETTNAGKFAKNEEGLKNILLEYYHEFIESGAIQCHSNRIIDNYTYNTIAKKYSEILNNL